MKLQVWFNGSTTTREIDGDGALVGSAGELKIFVGDRLTTVIAPHAWVFFVLPKAK